MTLDSRTIHRVSPRGPVGELIARKKAELFAAQSWTPRCARCGRSGRELSAERAQAWFAGHRCRRTP